MAESGGMNIDQQKASWVGFVKLFTWGTVGCALVAVLVVTIIS